MGPIPRPSAAAAAAVRTQLQALMAQAAMESDKGLKFTDRDVCRNYLCGLCPHDLFANTKFDLGKCPKVHSERLKDEYDEARKSHDYEFELDWFASLEEMVRERDRRIARDRAQLDETQNKDLDARGLALLHQISGVDDKIGVISAEIERLGSEGKVEEAASKMKEQEELSLTKRRLDEEMKARDDVVSIAARQKLRVCEICGAKLSLFDSDRRLADHFGGKMHLGMAQIREIVESMRPEMSLKRLNRKPIDPEADRLRDLERDRERDRDRDRDRRGERDYDRDRRRY